MWDLTAPAVPDTSVVGAWIGTQKKNGLVFFFFIEVSSRDWRDGSVVKYTHCSYRDPQFSFQATVYKAITILAPADLMHSLAPALLCT